MRRHLALALVLLASLPAMGAPPASGAGQGVLRGMVFDGSGKVVPGAVARLGKGLTAQCDKTGIFTIRVPAASYRVEVSAGGYKPDVQTIEVAAGTTKDMAAVLERAGR